MKGNPLLQLAALNENDAAEARRLLADAYGETLPDLGDVVDQFERAVETAICLGDHDVSLDIETAELIALLLKDRKRPRGRRRLSRAEDLRNKTAVSLASNLKKQKIAAGMKAGQAEEEAAREAAELAGKHGCRMSPTTIRNRMGKQGNKPRI